MPTYAYICDACQNEFEKFQSIKADPIKKCPVCHKMKVRRKISGGAAILFKGGGFYETDYRSAGYKESAKKESDAAAPKTETKSDGAKSEGVTSGSAKSDAPAPAKTDAPKAEKSTPASAPTKKDE